MENQLDTPVLFLIFNRFDTAKQVFDSIKNAKPQKLYLASDGARENKVGEGELVLNIREWVISNIDWECEVKTLFREKNLGCGCAVNQAIDWLFENEEMGIILEDDCLPSKSFFPFCDENLKKYKNDTRISAISGDNFHPDRLTSNSYFFSKFTYIWGWATWRRSWESHKLIMKNIDDIIDIPLKTLSINHKLANQRVINNATKAYKGDIDTWDYQWILSNYLNNGLVITPRVNLIKNIGFGSEATHTTEINSKLCVETQEMPIPLNHPLVMLSNNVYDDYLYNEIFQWKPLWKKMLDIKYVFSRIKDKLFALKSA
jgi:hypothetical protein